MRKKAEADYEDLKEELETETKLRAKLEREMKENAKGSKEFQALQKEAERLKQRVTQLEKMETEYKKYDSLISPAFYVLIIAISVDCPLAWQRRKTLEEQQKPTRRRLWRNSTKRTATSTATSSKSRSSVTVSEIGLGRGQ